MTLNLPNTLTILRLFAAPGVVIMFLYFTRPWADWFALVLFVGAAITDYFDGYLARAWKQQTKFGAMLDPIADKAMVVIALLVITGYAGMDPWILLPATVIIFREVFVSGLREFLGDTAGTLAVTNLAKWKTTAQMVAIAVLFGTGIFGHMLIDRMTGMDEAIIADIFAGGDDPLLLRLIDLAARITWWVGVGLLWVAAALTLITGVDYFRKAVPHLRDDA
ncbi:MAG: CDP-diacylglycerol--glycerol-3-phosphate 3-phosphatidyltransferase [Pseudomonadota bacterium]